MAEQDEAFALPCSILAIYTPHAIKHGIMHENWQEAPLNQVDIVPRTEIESMVDIQNEIDKYTTVYRYCILLFDRVHWYHSKTNQWMKYRVHCYNKCAVVVSHVVQITDFELWNLDTHARVVQRNSAGGERQLWNQHWHNWNSGNGHHMQVPWSFILEIQ